MGDAREEAKRASEELVIGRIKEALIVEGGNHTAAAERVGMSRSTFWRWFKRFKLRDWDSKREGPRRRRRAG
jgi:transcriptional regulator of acetoin/glycerol metabolism